MLGGDRFVNAFFVRFWVWGSWFSRTALLGLQKALFYKVSILKCYYGSRNWRIVFLNRAPVLGGNRFFKATSSVFISDRFSDRSRLRSKKVSKKVSKRIQNWKTWSLLGCDWGDGHKVNVYIYIRTNHFKSGIDRFPVWLDLSRGGVGKWLKPLQL